MVEKQESQPAASTVFLDGDGRSWDLSLNVGIVQDLKEKASIDIEGMLKRPEELALLFLVTPEKLVQTLWVVCEEQAEKHSIDPRAFGRLFKREIIDSAVDSFIAAIVLFYPRGSAGRVLADNLPAILRRMDDTIAGKAKRSVDRILSSIAIDSQASQE